MTVEGDRPRAVVLCEGRFGDPSGKTAHGLVRETDRFDVVAVVDSTLAGRDAGEVLDGEALGVPIVASLAEARDLAPAVAIVGVATDGGRLPPELRPMLREAIAMGLDVVSGLHEHVSEDPELVELARRHGVTLTDVRVSPPPDALHFFTGKIEEVTCPRVAVLGTDSAIGKRTTARLLVHALEARGLRAVFVATGQTGNLQGTPYGLVLDSLVNDYVTGEIEHQVHEAWRREDPDVIVVEGQGSITHPAYPGGFEIIAGARVSGVVLQHAPGRAHLDGFPQYPMPELDREIRILELLTQRPLLAITLNHENLTPQETRGWCERLAREHGVPAVDPLRDGLEPVVDALVDRFGLGRP